MKKIFPLIILSLFFNSAIAQVGVNNTNPQAQLDVSASSVTSPSNEDGILIPRIDNFPVTNPTATQDGMMVFATGNGTPTKGFYYWDNGTTSWISLLGSSSNDSDWYTQYSTNAPNSITDNIFTEGNVSINDGFLILNSPTDTSGGLYSYKTINTNTAFTYRLIQNSITSNGSTGSYLTQNSYTGTGSGGNTAITNLFNGTGTSSNTGLRNSFNNDNSTSEIGINNNFISTSSNQKIGVLNNLNSAAQNGTVYGFRNLIEGGTGTIYGTYTNITNGSAYQYGSYINLSGGTGPNYGLYSSVDNVTNGFAAYLVGRTSLGETTSNRYLMPAADGAAGQIMTTDGSGNISFTTPSTGGTLDQAYDFGGAGVGRTIIADNGAVDIQDAGGLRVEGDISAAENIVHDGDTDTFLTFTTDRIRLDSGGTNYVDIENSNTEMTINEDSSQIDFRVESDNQDHMLFIDGSADAIGIGENNPVNPLHIGITTPFDLSYANTGQDAIYLIGGGDNSGLNAIGSSIGFGPPSSTRGEQRKAAIASIQTSGDVDHLGLAFFVHGNDINQTDMTEGMRLTHDKNLGINNTAPDANLDVIGTMQFVDGNESAGYVLTSDATGNATWTDPNTLITTSTDWTTTGNTGTNPSTNFIGTTDAQDFSIRTDNVEKVRITTKGQIETTQLQSVWIGENAGNAVTTGSRNVFVGRSSGISTTTGMDNTAIGGLTLQSNTAGIDNTAVGLAALFSLTSGDGNTVIGEQAAENLATGSNNVVIGHYSGESMNGSNNIFIGPNSGQTVTGNNMLIIDNANDGINSFIYGEMDNNILRTNSQFQIGNPTTTGYAFPTVDGTFGQVLTTNGAGNLVWANSSSDDGDWTISGNNVFKNTGNVGIGWSNTAYPLTINDDSYINSIFIDKDNNGTSGGRAIYSDFRYTGSGAGYIIGDYNRVEKISSSTSTGSVFGDYNYSYNYYNGASLSDCYGSYNNAVKSGGTNGASYGVYANGYNESGNSAYGVYGVANNLYGNISYGIYGYATGGATTIYAGFFNGNVYSTGTYLPSARQLKTNIKDLSLSSLEKLNQLKIKSYQYNTNKFDFMNLPKGNQVGVIAEEMETIFPELIKKTIQPEADENLVKEGIERPHNEVEFKAVNYTGLVPHLVKAVQELNEEVNTLKEENIKLKEALKKQEQLEQ